MQKSIRNGYKTCGVRGFYEAHGDLYSNGHYNAICSCVNVLMKELFHYHFSKDQTRRLDHDENLRLSLQAFTDVRLSLKLFDLACGSGEGTRALIQSLPKILATETSSSSLPLIELQVCDPFTLEAFSKKLVSSPLPKSVSITGLHSFTFEDMNNHEPLKALYFDWCICSFALHLAESKLYGVLTEVARHARILFVLSPHKRPAIFEKHGWVMFRHIVVEKVHGWIYLSTLYNENAN